MRVFPYPRGIVSTIVFFLRASSFTRLHETFIAALTEDSMKYSLKMPDRKFNYFQSLKIRVSVILILFRNIVMCNLMFLNWKMCLVG